MAENRYQARGPENRTTLITVRVTAEHRELLRKLASERGETMTRMLLAPWLGAEGKKRPKSVKRLGGDTVKPAVATKPVRSSEAAASLAADPLNVADDEVAQVASPEPGALERLASEAEPAAKRSRRPRVNPDQESMFDQPAGGY